MATIRQLLASRDKLSQLSDSPGLDTELLLCFCLQKPRSYLRTWPDHSVPGQVATHFQQLLARRMRGEPIAYLTGQRSFWTLELAVNNATLIPRPETELLVETALQRLAQKNNANVLELGTGTGAIALALASEKAQWQILACDNCACAVALANKNRQSTGVNNVRIVQSDWYSAIGEQAFDLILSNPPYIDASDPHLQQGDVRYEPQSALVAANHGLADIEHIIEHAGAYLMPGAWLLFEHGYNQANAVRKLLLNHGFDNVFCKQDLAGIDRVSGGQFGDCHDL